MLARRFTIICLICMLLGMGMSFLVQNTARPAYSSGGSNSLPCVYDISGHCSTPVFR